MLGGRRGRGRNGARTVYHGRLCQALRQVFFFFLLFSSLELSDTPVYEPSIRALSGQEPLARATLVYLRVLVFFSSLFFTCSLHYDFEPKTLTNRHQLNTQHNTQQLQLRLSSGALGCEYCQRRISLSSLRDRRHAPYTLHPTPYTLHLTPYTLHPTLFTLHPAPYTLHPKPQTPKRQPSTPKPYTPITKPATLNPHP